MTAATRKPKPSDPQLRQIVADNVRRRMEARYRELRNQERKLATEAKVSLSTVQRVLSGERGSTIDTISAIARVFSTRPYKLLIDVDEARFIIDAREIVAAPAPESRKRSRHDTAGS